MEELVHLQLLRPWWLLAIFPVAWILWQAWQIKGKQGAWHEVIDPKFQTLLLGQGSQPQGLYGRRLAIIGLGMIWVMAIIALSGPSLKSVKLPAQKTQQGSVIILDLSLSMLADDLTPNRISRARFKLNDLVKQHPEHAMGLIGYAGSAHRITPISEDNETLLALLPALNPLIMPEYGSDPIKAFELAKSMLQGSQISQGHLIWVTDDIDPEQRENLSDWLSSSPYSLSILAVGTQQGGTIHIPNHGILRDDSEQIITPKLPYAELEKLSLATGSALTPLKVDDSDLTRLLPSNIASITAQKQSLTEEDKKVLHVLDDGTAILLAMLPLLIFVYRRGWLFSVLLVAWLPMLTYTPPAFAEAKLSDFKEVFQTPDQQGFKAWQKGDYEAAAALFENSQWKGSSLYKLGKYEEAEEQFKKDDSAKGLYNLGNALAKQGKWQQAKEAYKKSLEKDPNNRDAKKNLEQAEKQAKKQEQGGNTDVKDGQANGNQESNQAKQETSPQPSPQANANPSDESQANSNSQPESGNEENGENTSPQNASPAEEKSSDGSSSQGLNSEGEAENTEGQISEESESSQDNSNASTEDGSHENSEANQDTEQNENSTTASTQSVPEHSEQASESQASTGLGDTPANDENTHIKQTEQQQATDNWLKQIPDQPGLFLKHKFKYQYQQESANPTDKKTEKIW